MRTSNDEEGEGEGEKEKLLHVSNVTFVSAGKPSKRPKK